jgi:hypothetical protein
MRTLRWVKELQKLGNIGNEKQRDGREIIRKLRLGNNGNIKQERG